MARRCGSTTPEIAERVAAAEDLLRDGLHRTVVQDALAHRYRRSIRQARRYIVRVFERWDTLGADDPRPEIEARRSVAAAAAGDDIAALTDGLKRLTSVLERGERRHYQALLEMYDAALALEDEPAAFARFHAAAARAGLRSAVERRSGAVKTRSFREGSDGFR